MGYNFNTFHSDAWQCNFSNMPSLSGQADLAMYDNFVRSVVLPDYNMEEIASNYNGFKIRSQVAPSLNQNLSQLQIGFKISEDFLNYLNLFEFMRSTKYADATNIEGLFRKYTIKSIILTILDNQKREVAVMRFTEAFLLSLSSVSLVTGTSDEIEFTINCSYQELLYEKKSIYIC